MNLSSGRFQKLLKAILILLSMTMLLDFFIDERIETRVAEVKRTVQSHNNASGNSHFTYIIITEEIEFYTAASFARLVSPDDLVEIDLSILFREVNRVSYGTTSETYSLRWASGLFIPLICFVITVMSFQFPKRSSLVVLIAALAILGNLVLVWQ